MDNEVALRQLSKRHRALVSKLPANIAGIQLGSQSDSLIDPCAYLAAVSYLAHYVSMYSRRGESCYLLAACLQACLWHAGEKQLERGIWSMS